MKIISQYIKQKIHRFYIYENYQEFKCSAMALVNFDHINEGDYILFPNGYYAPLVSFSYVKKKNGVFLFMVFPRMQVSIKVKDNQGNYIEPVIKKEYSFNKQFEPAKFITSDDRYFALLLNKGLKCQYAYKIAYGNKSLNLMSNKLHKPGELMENLKDVFIKAGINENYIASHIKKVLDEGKEGIYKKKCLEIAIATVNSVRTDKNHESLNELKNVINNERVSNANPLLAN